KDLDQPAGRGFPEPHIRLRVEASRGDRAPVGPEGQRGDARVVVPQDGAFATRGRVPEPYGVVVASGGHGGSVGREPHRPHLLAVIREGSELLGRVWPPDRQLMVAAQVQARAVGGEGEILEGLPTGKGPLPQARRNPPDGRGHRAAELTTAGEGEPTSIG